MKWTNLNLKLNKSFKMLLYFLLYEKKNHDFSLVVTLFFYLCEKKVSFQKYIIRFD